jgi:hypothetical protein
MQKIKRAILASVVCVLAVGCGGNSQQVVNGMPAPDEAITVSVQNHNWQDVDVFAVNGSQRVRLGSVTTANTGVFVLPSSLMFAPDLRILVHPLASPRDFLSPRISASPGDVIQVTVVNAIAQTSVTIR